MFILIFFYSDATSTGQKCGLQRAIDTKFYNQTSKEPDPNSVFYLTESRYLRDAGFLGSSRSSWKAGVQFV